MSESGNKMRVNLGMRRAKLGMRCMKLGTRHVSEAGNKIIEQTILCGITVASLVDEFAYWPDANRLLVTRWTRVLEWVWPDGHEMPQ